MIAHPPQQYIYTYHLALSLIILLLTIYPYIFSNNCCSVAAFSSEDFQIKHSMIETFDIITGDDIILSKSISTRSIPGNRTQDTDQEDVSDAKSDAQAHERRRLKFSSLGLKFDIDLTRVQHLISRDFNVAVLDSENRATVIPFDRNNMQIFEGSLRDDPSSRVAASFGGQEKLLTAQIKSGSEIYMVEPTYLHKHSLIDLSNAYQPNASLVQNPKLYEKTMLVYRLSDHRQVENETILGFDPSKLCRATTAYADGYREVEHDLDLPKQFNSSAERLRRRGIEFFGEKQRQAIKDRTRCTLHIVADYLFYKHIGNGDKQTTINYLLALINRVNLIYLPTQWETGDDKSGAFNNIGFTVQDIDIHQEFTKLSSGDIHYNMQANKTWGAREFLDNFSRYSPPKHYCLAHLLTYRQFDSPVLGLAYVASTRFGTIGGICSPTQQRGDLYYKHNTGISTSKGINGDTLITRQADLVLAHELGHNLGAEHDSNECRPSPAQGGAYLMHPYAVMGFEKNNRFLSSCSRNSIGRVIKRKGPTCFVGVVDNVCGNGVVEDDEDCDGGDIGLGHSDPCCDRSCRFTPGSQCSDRHSSCCSKCRIVPAGISCRPAEEFNCKQASYCDGNSAKCPPATPVEDDKICVGKGLCRDGECTPFCEARSMYSCLCNSPADACKLCCKQSINGSCTPYDLKAPYLPDGVLCYRGVCEKGRCEQPIQDVIERLWDVIEDINLKTFVKFLRDNIILVVLVVSIPIWCILTHFINEFDRNIKQDVINSIRKQSKCRKTPPTQSPFLPRLFVDDGNSSTSSLNNIGQDAHQNIDRNEFDPLKSYSTQV